MKLNKKTAANGSISILELNERFDAYEVNLVKDWLNQQTADPPAKLIINLSGVTFIDSTALATLVQGMKHARQKEGDLILCGLQQAVRIIFELTRLDKAFDIVKTEEEAIKMFDN